MNIYDPDDVKKMLTQEYKDPQGNRVVEFVDWDDRKIKIIQYANGSTSLSASEYRGYP